MNDVLVIVNPSSGKQQSEYYAEQVVNQYKKHNREAQMKLTQKKEDISSFTKEGALKQYDTLIVMGGDGTVSEAINGLKNQKYRPKVGIIPTGTVNNIANSLTIPRNPDAAVQELMNSKEQEADVGVINDQLFLSSVSAGSLPEIVWEVEKEDKKRYGSVAYLLEGLRSITSEETFEVEMEIDDEKVDLELSLLLVGLSDSIIGIPDFFKGAKINDGKLYLFGLRNTTFGEKMTVASSLLSREKRENDERAFIYPFKEGAISLKTNVGNVAVDGEKGPSFPINVSVLPKYLTFLVPN